MEKGIELGQLEGIAVGFENVEVVYVPATCIHTLEVKGIGRSLYLESQDKTVRKCKTSDWVDLVVKEYGDTKVILEKGCNYAPDEYSSYKRLADSQDIVCIDYLFKDGSKETLYVDYQEDGLYYAPNENQENEILVTKDVPSGVHIRIASPKTSAKVQQEEAHKHVQASN